MFRFNLSSKIALLTALLLLGLGAVMMVTFGILSSRQIQRTIEADATVAAKQLDLYLASQSADIARRCRIAAEGDARTRGLIFLGDKITVQNDVDRLESQFSVSAVEIVNADGAMLGSSSGLARLSPEVIKPIHSQIAESLKGDQVRTSIVHGGTDICLLACVPVKSGAFLKGAICLINRLGRQQVRALALRTGDDLGLIADGEVVASSLDTPISPPAHTGLPSEIVLDGEPYVSISESLPTPGRSEHLEFVVLRPTRAITAPYTESRTAFISVLAVALALSIACGIAFGRSVAKPISSLAEAARVVQAGGWPEKLEVQRQDEIGTLQASFNDMVAASKDAQEQVALAQKVKREFLTNMSHELRTPMNGILGVSSILRDSLTEPGDIKLLDLIVLSSERLHGVLADILTLSSFEIESPVLKLEQLSLDDLIQSVVDLYRAEAFKKGLSVECAPPKSPIPFVMGDSIKLKQLFGHLLGNAIKFTEKGSVQVQWTYDGKAGGVGLEWSVSDTGIGIPDGALNHLFEPFVQLDGSKSRAFEGAGLGLAITRRIIDLMGGEISIDSKIGQGTIVRVRLAFPAAP